MAQYSIQRGTRAKQWIAYGAAFSAASALGGLIKVPSPVGSIAFDAVPGYFLAVYIHPVLGGIVGMIGHLASASTAGFPLGYLHIAVALQMFVWCTAFGLLGRVRDTQLALLPAAAISVALNGIVGPFMLAAAGLVPMALARSIWPVLTAASLGNVGLAALAVVLMARSAARREVR